MTNMPIRITGTSTNLNLVIECDRELSIGMTKEFGVPTLAVSLSQYELGVFVTLDKTAGVYGADVNKKAILS